MALAGLLFLAYLYAWTPARTAWTEQGADLLSQAAPAETTVRARPAAHTIRVAPGDDDPTTYTAPAGIKFLLPALFLVLIAPTRPWLGLFFAGHLALGAFALSLLAARAMGLATSHLLAQFLQSYGMDAYSLIVPVLIFANRNAGA
jgi:hypothetical protein